MGNGELRTDSTLLFISTEQIDIQLSGSINVCGADRVCGDDAAVLRLEEHCNTTNFSMQLGGADETATTVGEDTGVDNDFLFAMTQYEMSRLTGEHVTFTSQRGGIQSYGVTQG